MKTKNVIVVVSILLISLSISVQASDTKKIGSIWFQSEGTI